MRVTLELETSGLAGFYLPGMGGESSPLVTEIEPPRGGQVNKSSDQVSGLADGNNVGDDVGNVGDDVGKVIGAKVLSATGRAVCDVIRGNPFATVEEIATAIGKIARKWGGSVSLGDAGLMVCTGGMGGHWKVKRWH